MTEERRLVIRVPASTANLGPGFDVLGAALAVYLILRPVQPVQPAPAESKRNSGVSLDPRENLISKIAMFVALAHGTSLPSRMHVAIHNAIPLGRGMGSSGAAVVAGVALASAVCNLGLSPSQMLDYACLIEGHPDNVAASVYGGMVSSVLKYDLASDIARLDARCFAHYPILHPHRHPERAVATPSSAISTPNSAVPGSNLPDVPKPRDGGTAFSRHISLSPAIKAVVAIPRFQLPTHIARGVLPQSYTRQDVIFNLQRLCMLVQVLGDANPSPSIIREAMQDRIHQTYRQHLVPGLEQILQLSHNEIPGLLGVCLSGAGPTVLALATDNFDAIGTRIRDIFMDNVDKDGNPIVADYLVLEFDRVGVVITEE
eukprot:jgi/Hompol1/5339/HPOL_001234-RA